MTAVEPAGRQGYAALDPCVHCGFCLPACPTYLATGDENDSPRGRILLMRALEAGELPPHDPALRHHLDACLGCRGCEPVCPSGVGYGRALETARADLAAANGLPPMSRAILAVFRSPWLWRPALTLLRWLRASGLAARLAGKSRIGFGMGMVAGGPDRPMARGPGGQRAGRPGGQPAGRPGGQRASRPDGPAASSTGAPADRRTGPLRVALFRGCVMDTLYAHVHDATVAALAAGGHVVVEVPGQECCGALHAHAGALGDARALAARNITAFDRMPCDLVAVTSAGCGALLRDYAHLVPGAGAERLAAKIRDITEILAASTLPYTRELDLDIVYDPPCHLQHAQQVHDAPLAALRAIPGVRVHLLPGADRCCGGAGLYGTLHPELSRAILAEKVEAIRTAVPTPDLLVTGNPGCLMQFSAGLRAAGLDLPVAHPAEVVGWALGGER